MSATVARDFSQRPKFMLVGPPQLSRASSIGRGRVNVVGGGSSNWQDETVRLAAQCNPGLFKSCGCPESNGCSCASPAGGSPNDPSNKPYSQMTEMERAVFNCNRGRWVPNTITNPAVVAAGAAGTATFSPQAAYKLARVTLSAAQAADFTGITIAVGPVQNILPGVVDGTYFSIAAGGDGYARIDCGAITAGQNIVFNFISTAGVAAGAARITLQGGYGAQTEPHY